MGSSSNPFARCGASVITNTRLPCFHSRRRPHQMRVLIIQNQHNNGVFFARSSEINAKGPCFMAPPLTSEAWAAALLLPSKHLPSRSVPRSLPQDENMFASQDVGPTVDTAPGGATPSRRKSAVYVTKPSTGRILGCGFIAPCGTSTQ